MKKKFKRKGFTLIELLVVISIIAMLMSVILGSVNSSRKKANIAKAAQEVKSLQTALQLYYDDNGDWPPAGVGNIRYNASNHDTPWADLGTLLAPYLKQMPTPSFTPNYFYRDYGYSKMDCSTLPCSMSVIYDEYGQVMGCVKSLPSGYYISFYDVDLRTAAQRNDGGLDPVAVEGWGGAVKFIPPGGSLQTPGYPPMTPTNCPS